MKSMIYGFYSNKELNLYHSAFLKANQVSTEELPYDIEIVAENLNIPWAMDISEDGALYFTERIGIIRKIENDSLYPDPLITLSTPFVSIGEGGLLGLVLDPDFTQNHYLYIMHTYMDVSGIFNRVVRLKEISGIVLDKVLINRIPGGRIHNGGRLKIGPDRKLYITTGDAGDILSAQNRSNLAGKILRIELDGSIPEDNPFPGSPVYSYGHRNPQGLAWNTNGILYATEHGQSAQDEINIIQAGANYGWPIIQGEEDTQEVQVERPLLQSGRYTWAPSGMVFLTQGPWMGKLGVAALRGEQLLLITLDSAGTNVENANGWLVGTYGRLRDIYQAKDGSIFLMTNNRDGRGAIQPGDDKIIRLVPKQNTI